MPVIDGPYTLSQGADAFRHFGDGHHQGKVIITMGPLSEVTESKGSPERAPPEDARARAVEGGRRLAR